MKFMFWLLLSLFLSSPVIMGQAPSPSDCWDPTFCGVTIISGAPSPTETISMGPSPTDTAPPPTDPPSTSDPVPSTTNPPASDPPPSDPPGCIIVSKAIDFKEITPDVYLYKDDSHDIVARFQPNGLPEQIPPATKSANITLVPITDPELGYRVELDDVGDAFIQFDFCDGDSFRVDFHVVEDPEEVLSAECFGLYQQIKLLHEYEATCETPPDGSECTQLWADHATAQSAAYDCRQLGGDCTTEIQIEIDTYSLAGACHARTLETCESSSGRKQQRCYWYNALKCNETWEAPECAE